MPTVRQQTQKPIDLLSATAKSPSQDIDDRRSQELVIALVGPVGSGVSTAASHIYDTLSQTFKYSVRPILKLSDIIKMEASRVGVEIVQTPRDQYITTMQSAGNILRETYGGSYLVEKAIEAIYKFRKEQGGLDEKGNAKPGRRAFIIDSLKNLEELDLLRKVYGKTLCVIGVFAPDQLRKARLDALGVPDASVQKIMDRDQSELPTFGQNTRKLFVQSDFFVCNDTKIEAMKQSLTRFLEIIYDVGVHTPKREEGAMYEAASAAAHSACMSRQVGAAIVSADGELIAVGHNDVPRFGGGLYVEDDQSHIDSSRNTVTDRDWRCFKWRAGLCHNEDRRKSIVRKIAHLIAAGDLLKKNKTVADVLEQLEGTEVDDLIEFSRSIHAEMEAILSVAREGRRSLVGATLYTSTYPCHNCARHIVAAGIKRVVYIEPYRKSQAISLHADSVTEDPNESGKVIFSQYSGVAPSNFLFLFKPDSSRKKDGKLHRVPAASALPVMREPLDARIDYEAKIINDLTKKEGQE